MRRTKRKADLLSQSASPSTSGPSPLAAPELAPLAASVVAVEDLFRRASRDYAKLPAQSSNQGETGGAWPRMMSSFSKILEKSAGADLHCWFTALARCASHIPFGAQRPLLDMMLSFRWHSPNSSDALVQAVAGSKGILTQVYKTLTSQMRCKHDSVGEVDAVTTRDTVMALHVCLRRLLALVPSSGVALFQAVEQAYPYKSLPSGEQLLFLEATLEIASYCEPISSQLFDLVMAKLLLLDTDIPDQALDGSTGGMADADLPFVFENESESSGDAPEEIRVRATTLDHCMEILFNYIDSRHLEAIPAHLSSLQHMTLNDFPAECRSQALFFSTLVSTFHTRVLPTLRCKVVQFAIFYACGKQPFVYSRIFIASLLNVFSTNATDRATRAMAVLYLQSFVARFAPLPPAVIRDVVATLCQWARARAQEVALNPVANVPDSEQHNLFYVVVSAILYILCFRARELRSVGVGAEVRAAVAQLAASPLNPLLFVPKQTRSEAVQLVDLLDVDGLRARIKANKRVLRGGKSMQPIPYLFPFDPYALTQSEARFVAWYKHWDSDARQAVRGEGVAEAGESSGSPVRSPVKPSSNIAITSYDEGDQQRGDDDAGDDRDDDPDGDDGMGCKEDEVMVEAMSLGTPVTLDSGWSHSPTHAT